MNVIDTTFVLPTAPRVLIADDSPFVRSSLAMQLASGFEVVAAARDAAEAVELAAELRPDIAILDVEMPQGGGPRAAREIADCSPETTVVAYSGDETRSGVLAMISAGAVAYLRKDLTGHDLAATLRTCVVAKHALS